MPLLTVLVEDNKTIREQLIPSLEELAGARVIAIADTSSGAAAVLKEHGDVWRLAVVDIFLREGSGLEVIAECERRGSRQKVVALTNYATVEMRKRCIALGADAVFDKSTELDDFMAYCSALGARH
ncbi:MAG: response regulator [Comamonadaceae bacterium]|nr:MAG: response regulator [Comamonadaceae bacterium]